jgi:regulator of protease activity HflC (stomatin/prohibitin superfamily)
MTMLVGIVILVILLSGLRIAQERQETITRDSVTVKVNAVLWYRITDAARSVIAVTDAATSTRCAIATPPAEAREQ